MKTKKERPQVLADRGGARKTWGTNTPHVNTLSLFVNQIRCWVVLRFRNAVVDGIALAGWPTCPWLSKLVDRLTVLADALAEKSGVRA